MRHSGAVLVTGATGGLGRACVAMLLDHGIPVAAVGRNSSGLSELRQSFGHDPRLTVHTLLDPVSGDSLAALLDEVLSVHATVTGLVTCAGAYRPTPLRAYDAEAARYMVDVNLLAPMAATAAVARVMTSGSVVHVGSITSRISRGGFGGYEAAKAGLVAASRSAAVELAHEGISVNVVEPGWMSTPMAAEFLLAADPDEIHSLIPIGRASEPDEVAAVVVWLLLEAPPTLTGQTIVVDGGQSARTGHLAQSAASVPAATTRPWRAP